MTKEDKELLLKDLCTRLQYGVKGKVYAEVTNGQYDMNGEMIFYDTPFDVILDGINTSTEEIHVVAIGNEDTVDFIEMQQTDGAPYTIDDFKPYLRPMSSMTEEEWETLRLLKGKLVECDENNDEKFYGIINEIHTFYYSCHIDCNGLIEKGLALEAPEGMYNLNKK